ncbi:Transmembrane channel-like protein [Dirofilaria immitis]
MAQADELSDPMGIMANRSVLQLLLSSAVLLCNISAQQIFLEQRN